MSSYLNLTTIGTGLAIAYMVILSQQLYNKLYPIPNTLDKEDVGPTFDPLWDSKTKFHLIGYVTSKSAFSSFSLSKYRDEGKILFENRDIYYNISQQTIELNLLLVKNNTNQYTSNTSILTTLPTFAWKPIYNNKTSLYIHVMLLKDSLHDQINYQSIRDGMALHDYVQLIKYDKIPKHFKQRYLLSDLGYVTMSEDEAFKLALPTSTIISYWKPEVAVRIVNDVSQYPQQYIPEAVAKNLVQRSSSSQAKSSPSVLGYYKPALFVDEIGLTSDKYIPLNRSIDSLPLKISFGPMSLQKWLLMANVEESLTAQADFGFSDKDIDDVRRLISETSPYLLAVTFAASLLHLLFEILAFQSDISFWQNNQSLTGLSTRSVVIELFSQIIVFLFLVDSDSSLLITIPSAFGILIQLWKVKKATGLVVVRNSYGIPILEFQRWKAAPLPATIEGNKDAVEEDEKASQDRILCEVTLEADRLASVQLTSLLLPIVLVLVLRSLIYEKHLSWYSWWIGSLTGCVYTFGFILMCPQLYINHKLKSVSHLPWKFLVYKFLNTFIDDLFAFVIKMPTMHRLSVFRDDIVFLIYLYQRWIYRIDTNRPVEK